MTFSDDIFLSDKQCEICGAELSDEIVIQEFADGSIARLCAECAAGAALTADTSTFQFPDPGGDPEALDPSAGDEAPPDETASLDLGAAAASIAPARQPASAESDALEKTRELLTPVVDLITLQSEMQGALHRLAASLQTFATGVMSESSDKSSSVENRLEALERELVRRRFGPAVRLEVADDIDDEVVQLLVSEIDVDVQDVQRVPGLLDLSALWQVYDIDRPALKERPFVPATRMTG